MSKTVLVPGKDLIILRELYARAAKHFGLELKQCDSLVYTKPIKSYQLSRKILAFLDKRKIKLHQRPGDNNEIITLMDENPQKEVPGWVSTCWWNFKAKAKGKGFNLKISLGFSLRLDANGAGIWVFPHADCPYVGPCDHLPNWRMFQALVSYDSKAPEVAKQMAASKGNIFLSWEDLALGGLVTIEKLFMDFAGGNKALEEIASKCQVFDPKPLNYGHSLDRRYITKPAQTIILTRWRKQLVEYRKKLVA